MLSAQAWKVAESTIEGSQRYVHLSVPKANASQSQSWVLVHKGVAMCLYSDRPRDYHLEGNVNGEQSDDESISRVQRRTNRRFTR